MEHSRYVVRRRARFQSLSGQANFPYGTKIDAWGGFLRYEGGRLCVETSQNAHDYFSQDDDGKGLIRGELVGNILKTLGDCKDKNRQAKWDRVWDDKLCQQYKRPERDDFWIWNHEFYGAPVEDLRHIARLVGAK